MVYQRARMVVKHEGKDEVVEECMRMVYEEVPDGVGRSE